MTDKHIIIIDLTQCPHYREDKICTYLPYKTKCEGDCNWTAYKEMEEKLLRKEQECEKIKEDNATLFDKAIEARKECTDLKEQLFLLKIDYAELEKRHNDSFEQFNQLKAENDKYSLFIEKLCDYAGLECDSEEQAMRTLSDLASQMNKARWIIDKYKQTLTEIKPVLEIYSNSKIGEILDDGRSMAYLWSKDSFGFPIPDCSNVYIYDPNPAKQALQKISGVTNGS